MMTNFNLFSEIYGCYFSVIERIILEAQNGMSRKEIEDLVQSEGFYDSAFHMLPKLFSGEWAFLEEKADHNFYTKATLSSVKRPLTGLEKAWLKSLLLDPRILLFVSAAELAELELALIDVEPLFMPQHFHVFDSAADGDPYQDENYIRNFRTILDACRTQQLLRIEYISGKQKELRKTIMPYKIVYSSRDDKFRLLGVLIQRNNNYTEVTLNIGRLCCVEVVDEPLSDRFDVKKYLGKHVHPEPIVLSISTERRALERCMLQFASWEKETEYDEKSDRYLCKLYYEKSDETELLIRILGFGPVVKVLGHDGFLRQVRERVFRQWGLNHEDACD